MQNRYVADIVDYVKLGGFKKVLDFRRELIAVSATSCTTTPVIPCPQGHSQWVPLLFERSPHIEQRGGVLACTTAPAVPRITASPPNVFFSSGSVQMQAANPLANVPPSD